MSAAARLRPSPARRAAGRVEDLALDALRLELRTHPKPGLVSPLGRGSHPDMDAALFEASARAIAPFFADLCLAGANAADLAALRAIGRRSEAAMLRATRGVNTHRGAIFGLGLLSAAIGANEAAGRGRDPGATVRRIWGRDLAAAPPVPGSNGTRMLRAHAAGGARAEAASGFASIASVGRPALARGRALAPHDPEAARIHALFALIAAVGDTNLLHRGGARGAGCARALARRFLDAGGVGAAGWRERADRIDARFVSMNLSPGGSADLLAMTLFLDRQAGG